MYIKVQLYLPTASEGWGKVMFSVWQAGGDSPARSRRGRGIPQPGQGRGYLGYPQARSGWGLSLLGGTQVPPQARSGLGVPRVPPSRARSGQGVGGTPQGQVRTGGTPPPPPGQDSTMEYLTSGSRYASCVHAGGLSCLVKAKAKTFFDRCRYSV